MSPRSTATRNSSVTSWPGWREPPSTRGKTVTRLFDIFAKWVPNVDLAVAKKAIQHISYDPRISPSVMQAFEAAEDDILKLTLKDAPRLNIREQFASSFLTEVQKAHPEYFSDLPPLPAEKR